MATGTPNGLGMGWFIELGTVVSATNLQRLLLLLVNWSVNVLGMVNCFRKD